MDARQLRALSKVSTLRFSELREREPDLYRALLQTVATRAKAFLRAQRRSMPPHLAEFVQRLDIEAVLSSQAAASATVGEMLDRLDAPPDVRDDAQRLVDQLDRAGLLLNRDLRDLTLAEHPALEAERRRMLAVQIAELAGFEEDRSDALLRALGDDAILTPATFERLADDPAIGRGPARRFAVTADAVTLADGSIALARHLIPHGGDAPRSAAYLAALSADDWKEALSRARAVVPPGLGLSGYARKLQKRAQNFFPTTAFQALAPRLEPDDAASAGFALVRKVVELNPTVEFVSLDYRKDSDDLARVNTGTLAADEIRQVFRVMKARQRVFALARDVSTATEVLAAGFDSAQSIARVPFPIFGQKSGLDPRLALDLHRRAHAMTAGVAGAWGATLEALPRMAGGAGPAGAVPMTPMQSAVSAENQTFLKSIEGYEDLFGGQDYCRCEACQSILSPAAYFVDLMQFIDVNVRQVFFTGAAANHPLSLFQRRSDLWTLPLTCQNTDELVPYLQIVNTILEQYIAKEHALAGDPAAVVYEQVLAATKRSIREPFVLPLERLKLYVAFLETSRARIARALGSPQQVVTQAVLGLSADDRSMITGPNVAQAFLETIFGATFTIGGGGVIDPFESKLLTRGAGMTRGQLGELAATDFVTAGGTAPFTLKAEKAGPGSVQNDIERVHGITLAHLDRMHRLARLQRRLPWSTAELDQVLTHLGQAGLGTALDATTLESLARLLTLAERFGTGAEATIPLFHLMPQQALPDGEAGLLDRTFSPAYLADPAAPLPDGATRLIHPSFRAPASPGPADNRLHRIRGGLQVSDEELAVLIRSLATPLGLDFATANEDDRGFFMSLANLSLLYRHALAARALRLTMSQLFQLLALGKIGAGHLAGIADVEALLDVHQWWSRSGLSLDEIAYITQGPVVDASKFLVPDSVATAIVQEVATEKKLEFADTSLAYLPDVTETQSRAIIAANAARFERLDGGALRLIPDFQPAVPLTVPAGVTVAEPVLRAALMAYHSERILNRKLEAHLGTAPGAISQLLAMAGIDLFAPGFAVALHIAALPALSAALARLARLAVLFRHPVFTADTLAFVLANKGLFSIVDFNTITIASLRELVIFARLGDTTADALFVTQRRPADAVALRQAMTGFSVLAGFGAVPLPVMAAALRDDPALVSTLLGRVSLPAQPASALMQLAQAAETAAAVGVDGVALQRSVSDLYDQMSLAADAILGAIRARYKDPAELANRLDPLEDKLRSRKRDGLAEGILREPGTPFRDKHELYAYFLCDVEMEGCARTSLIVAALSSLQLYLSRISLNLEEDRTPGTDAGHIRVSLSADAALELRWRKNFRVWQANRKVFLFTHHYLEPTLLDRKTPLLEELEQTVLQKEVSADNALDGYGAYLSGFDEVTRLSVAGSYHDIDAASGRDTLHLLGVTAADPPVYYHRAIANTIYGESRTDRAVDFGPWKKINVQIAARRASPVMHLGRLHVFWNNMVTKPLNSVSDGGSIFVGYRHTILPQYTTLKVDGSWSTPQSFLLQDPRIFKAGHGVVIDDLQPGKSPYYSPGNPHGEPVEGYGLGGFLWERPYPEHNASGLFLALRAFAAVGFLDFYRKALGAYGAGFATGWEANYFLCARDDGTQRNLYYGTQKKAKFPAYVQTTSIADSRRLALFDHTDGLFLFTLCLKTGLYQKAIATISPTAEINVINGAVTDAVIDSDGDLILLQRSAKAGPDYIARRLGTSLVEPMMNVLFTGGVDRLLDTAFQLSLKERPNPIAILANIDDRVKTTGIDFKGSLGAYFTEIFLHIPMLLGSHLNSLGKYQEAQRWYEYVFSPTSNEVTTPATDRVWRYSQFRNLGMPTLQSILTDKAAIDVYRHDPFNPHAIARLRLSAYQKCAVLKYVDNLLDWADSLFTLFTTESVGEATLLYVMASEILGPRPEPIGDCEQPDAPRTFAKLKPLLDKGTDFVVELESLLVTFVVKTLSGASPAAPGSISVGTATGFDLLVGQSSPASVSTISAPLSWKKQQQTAWSMNPKNGVSDLLAASAHSLEEVMPSGFAMGLVAQYGALFCIPEDEELGKYWDRIEDRLFKIHNCMDITGARRKLELFAPEIDPRLLVRGRAEGLSLEDVLATTTGSLPPYRFTYLIERAKPYVSALLGFGSQLLSALEKKDAEELNRLRTVHQQKILAMSTRIRKWEVQAADDAIAQIERQQSVVQFRINAYKDLADRGMSPSEQRQQDARDTASDLQVGAAALDTLASVAHLLPQLGSPFSLKWGGLELGSSSRSWSGVARVAAGGFEAKSTQASVAANFQRRDEGWRHQQRLAESELPPLEKALTAQKLRKQMAEQSQNAHEELVSQIEELWRFHNDRFTNLAQYTFLSTSLQRLFREAYVTALGMARLCEQAYRYERNAEAVPLLSANHWDASRAGLLAGEQLLLELQHLEKMFIESNFRQHEVDQPFSLAQIDPAALVRLRETGACEFSIPELFFDLVYPGHYLRRIRAVRLSVPCVTGPFTNIGATLTLTGSFVRNEPKLGSGGLKAVPLRHTTSIATSTAQNDPGVLEFSFRDERYMPFEGAGAISKWLLQLPASFRSWDYQTMNDVIIHIAYVAEHDELLRTEVEETTGLVEGALLKTLRTVPSTRALSLRQDYSTAFNRIVHGAAGTTVRLDVGERHLSTIFRGRPVELVSAKLVLRLAPGQTAGAVSFGLNGVALSGFASDPALGGVPSVVASAAFAGGVTGEHELTVQNPGNLAPAVPRPGDPSVFDDTRLLDIMLLVAYRLKP